MFVSLPADAELFDEAADQISDETYRFRLMCNARALLDCMLTIIETTEDYGFHEISDFDRAIKSCFYA